MHRKAKAGHLDTGAHLKTGKARSSRFGSPMHSKAKTGHLDTGARLKTGKAKAGSSK